MNESNASAGEAMPLSKGFLIRVAELWQWLVVLFLALLVIALLSDQSKLAAPGAPVALFWAAIGTGVLVALAQAPPLFMRLPHKGKVGVYVASVAYVLLFGFTLSQVAAAWEKTPQGAAEAKQSEANRDAVIAEGVRQRSAEDDRQRALSLQAEAKAKAEQLEDCFTAFGHRLPALEKPFKEALHNPDAFEHVETLAIIPDVDGHNVAMKFRAENGLGAIRLGTVKATVDPATCAVVSTGNPQPM